MLVGIAKTVVVRQALLPIYPTSTDIRYIQYLPDHFKDHERHLQVSKKQLLTISLLDDCRKKEQVDWQRLPK
jgi:hypothetical protein